MAGVHTGSAQPRNGRERERETTGRERDDKIASFRSTPAGPNAIPKRGGGMMNTKRMKEEKPLLFLFLFRSDKKRERN